VKDKEHISILKQGNHDIVQQKQAKIDQFQPEQFGNW